MAAVRSEHLHMFIARVGTAPENSGRVVGMHVERIERFTETGQATREFPLQAETVDWDGLVALMHPDDRASLASALEAAEDP